MCKKKKKKKKFFQISVVFLNDLNGYINYIQLDI